MNIDTATSSQGINPKLVNMAIILVIACAIAFLAFWAVPRITHGAKTASGTAKAAINKVTDPYGDMTPEEIYSKITEGGDKYGIHSMTRLEKKMLGQVVSKANEQGYAAIGKVEDANKIYSEDPASVVLWVILYRDSQTDAKSQICLVQMSYSEKWGVGIQMPSSNPNDDSPIEWWLEAYGAPASASFSDRISEK